MYFLIFVFWSGFGSSDLVVFSAFSVVDVRFHGVLPFTPFCYGYIVICCRIGVKGFWRRRTMGL